MLPGGRRYFPARHLGTAPATLGVSIALAVLLAVHAAASTGITITSEGCAGGGSTFCYSPASASATAGSPVTWTNNSGVVHTATSCTASACPGAPASTGNNTFNVSIGSSTGSSGSFTFTSPGTYYYYCAIHGYSLMHGTITVTASSTSPTPSSAGSTSASPTPHGGAAGVNSPGTGAAPTPLAAVAIILGAALTALAVRRRRH